MDGILKKKYYHYSRKGLLVKLNKKKTQVVINNILRSDNRYETKPVQVFEICIFFLLTGFVQHRKLFSGKIGVS